MGVAQSKWSTCHIEKLILSYQFGEILLNDIGITDIREFRMKNIVIKK